MLQISILDRMSEPLSEALTGVDLVETLKNLPAVKSEHSKADSEGEGN